MVFPLGSKSWVQPVSINHYHVISDRDEYIEFSNECMLKCPGRGFISL